MDINNYPYEVTPNRKAILDAISIAEGTFGKGDRGYNILFGGKAFESYDDHPRKKIYIPRLKISTTAAGRYQELARTYDDCHKVTGGDFSPEFQDQHALLLIEREGALADVDAGHVGYVVQKCANIWASFKGNTYGQPTVATKIIVQAFLDNGGKVA